jgi:hypothetical protein
LSASRTRAGVATIGGVKGTKGKLELIGTGAAGGAIKVAGSGAGGAVEVIKVIEVMQSALADGGGTVEVIKFIEVMQSALADGGGTVEGKVIEVPSMETWT